MSEINNFDYVICLQVFSDFAKKQMKPFLFEEVKEAYLRAGNPEPERCNVYGRIVQQMSRDGLIFVNNYARSLSTSARGGVVAVWISKEYRLKQQKNATAYKGEALF